MQHKWGSSVALCSTKFLTTWQPYVRPRQLPYAGHSYLLILFEICQLKRVDIHLFDRDRGENIVSSLAWVIIRRIAHGMLEDFIVPLLFCFIFSRLAGFLGNIGIFFAVVLLDHYIAITFAWFCVALLGDFTSAALMTNLFSTVQTYGSGFIAQPATIPVYVRWVKSIFFVSSGNSGRDP